MPEFPMKESDISALASRMIGGLRLHGADFPDIDWVWLDIKYRTYKNREGLWRKAYAHLHLATQAKNVSLDTLRELMKNCLKKSAIDVAGEPDKLQYIGWGPKANPQPTEVPGQPTDLRIIAQGRGTILLNFDRPAAGTVRNYIIERRDKIENGTFGSWTLAGSSLNTEINLTDQPRGVQLEYRIKAINTGGESTPSNTAAIVL